ncbi:amino acid permease [Niveispirillum sp.]|uniref:amino acid permease n=1 Tax=Niveispirillum sp. TaxID=1917217 RepID=UPI001B74535E|nr:amino acid permease [Niveispirillum sp.]MBP7336943.1 amino acid permease [Niveispirillum sp.]
MRTRDQKIGPVAAGAIVAGNMIGSGVFLLPASLGAIGSITVVGWVAVLAGCLLLGWVCSTLAMLRPGGLGLIAHVHDALGRYLGFQSAFVYWISTWFGNVAIALAVTGYLGTFVAAMKVPPVLAGATIAIIWLMTLVNLSGARLIARFEGVALVLGLAPVMLVGGLGWAWFDPDIFAASWNVTGGSDLSAVSSSLGLIIWAFLGLESAAVVAAVVRRPERDVPLATAGGIGLAGVTYIVACTALSGVMPASELAASTAPFADVAVRIWGPVAGSILAVCAMVKAAGTLAGWMLVGAETAEAAAELGLFPRFLSKINRNGAPSRNLIVTAVLMSVVCVATLSGTLGEQFSMVVNMAVILNVLVYVYACLSLLRLSGTIASTGARRRAQAVSLTGLAFGILIIALSEMWMLAVAAVILALTVPLYLLGRAGRSGPAS